MDLKSAWDTWTILLPSINPSSRPLKQRPLFRRQRPSPRGSVAGQIVSTASRCHTWQQDNELAKRQLVVLGRVMWAAETGEGGNHSISLCE